MSRLNRLLVPHSTAPDPAPDYGPVRRILIIDDEEDIRDIAGLSLRTMTNWQTIAVASAEEGIAIAGREPLDAILMDMVMPTVDGPSALRRLQANPLTSRIPIVMLTARTQGFARRGFDGLGAAGILLKPFDPMTLARQLADTLGWK